MCNDPKVIKFNFSRSKVRFTKWEFTLITGLKFCQFPTKLEVRNIESTNLRKRLLEDKYDLKPPDLE